MLKIEHLRKHFGKQVVLDDISLEVNRGEVLSIIGQSGMGKSIILKHIVGLIIPDGGRVVLDGEEVSSPAMHQRDFDKHRRRFGMLFQGAALFDSKSVGENIAFPLREHTTMSVEEIRDRVAESLAMVGLQGIEQKMPAELSGGMRSRVGLARALAMRPEIMLYDEPTSALDPIMSDKISDLIVELKEKLHMTSVVVTHDMNSAYRISDKIAMIYQGKIIFCGAPAEIRASRNPYIQQFISGRRKLHYAVTAAPEEKAKFEQHVDLAVLQHRARMAEALRGLKVQPTHDALTGLLTGASLKQQIDVLLGKGRQSSVAVSVLCGEVDGFAEIEKQYGRAFSEGVLRAAAAELKLCVRGDSDFVSRLGDHSFGLVLFSTDRTGAGEVVNRVQRNIAAQPRVNEMGTAVPVTMSFGVTVFQAEDATADVVIARADQALASARAAGANRAMFL